jgi:Uma2 family endonuclease
VDAARKLPTFEDLYAEIEALQPGLSGEIVAPGVVRMLPRPGGPHSYASLRILRALRAYNVLDDGTGWWIEIEREIRFLEDLLYVPDLSGWRAEEPPDFVDANPITVRPDWVCEILSRSTQRGDRALKLPVYARAGVGHVWIVDPEARSVEVFASQDGLPLLVSTATGDARKVLPPFPDEIAVGDLWKPRKNTG